MNIPGFVVLAACMLVAAHGQSAEPRSYSAKEIDAKLAALRDQLMAGTMSRDEIGVRFEELRGLIAATPNKQEVAGQLNSLRQDIAAQKQAEDDRNGKLSQEIGALNGKIPSFPGWVSPLVAAIGVLISAGVAHHIANRNQAHNDVQRAEDKARSFLEDLNTAYDKIGRAMGFLEHPNSLRTVDNLNQVRAVGNLYNSIGVAWRKGDASASILGDEKIDAAAAQFWEALQRASAALGNPAHLEELIDGWDGIGWLAHPA